MHDSPRFRATRLIVAGILLGVAAPAICQVSVRTVKVLGSNDVVELEVEASDRIVPQTQVLSGPDRLVIDFPNSRPTDQVRSQSVDRGEVKDVRVGLFQSNPPVTRLVVDLKTAQNFPGISQRPHSNDQDNGDECADKFRCAGGWGKFTTPSARRVGSGELFRQFGAGTH